MTAEELKKYSDSRRYNLILCMGAGRLQGWFVPYGRNDTAPALGISTAWASDPERILDSVENAVYDHPMLLEDYDCRILVDTPRLLLFPAEAPATVIDRAMERFYDVAPEDVFTHELCGAVIAFSLCRGLRPFLSRTYAGVTPQHPLVPLCRWFSRDAGVPGRIRIYADIDAPWLHLMAFSGDRLLHASTHGAATTADAAYFIFALWKQLEMTPDDGQVYISGNPAMRKELMPLLRRHINYVGLSLLPAVEDADNVPTAVLLAFDN